MVINARRRILWTNSCCWIMIRQSQFLRKERSLGTHTSVVRGNGGKVLVVTKSFSKQRVSWWTLSGWLSFDLSEAIYGTKRNFSKMVQFCSTDFSFSSLEVVWAHNLSRTVDFQIIS